MTPLSGLIGAPFGRRDDESVRASDRPRPTIGSGANGLSFDEKTFIGWSIRDLDPISAREDGGRILCRESGEVVRFTFLLGLLFGPGLTVVTILLRNRGGSRLLMNRREIRILNEIVLLESPIEPIIAALRQNPTRGHESFVKEGAGGLGGP